LTNQAAFTEELVRTQECDDGLLALLGHHRNFNFTLLDLEEGICGFPLCKKYLTLSVRGNSPALGGSRQKSCGINSPRNRLGASFRLTCCHWAS
jgi:hypothetical protein